jgi:hypothetical protein
MLGHYYNWVAISLSIFFFKLLPFFTLLDFDFDPFMQQVVRSSVEKIQRTRNIRIRFFVRRNKQGAQ